MRHSYCCILRFMSFRFHWIKKNIIVSIIFFLIYVLNRIFKTYIDTPFVGYILKYYFNDFIGGFLFPAYVNVLLFCGNKNLLLSIKQLFLFMIPVSITWEFIFPLFLSYSTPDIIDIFSYLLGTLLYYVLICKKKTFKTNF